MLLLASLLNFFYCESDRRSQAVFGYRRNEHTFQVHQLSQKDVDRIIRGMILTQSEYAMKTNKGLRQDSVLASHLFILSLRDGHQGLQDYLTIGSIGYKSFLNTSGCGSIL